MCTHLEVVIHLLKCWSQTTHIGLVVYNVYTHTHTHTLKRLHECNLYPLRNRLKKCYYVYLHRTVEYNIFTCTSGRVTPISTVSDAKRLNISVTRVAKIVLKFIATEDVWPTISTLVKYIFKKHILTRDLYRYNLPYHRNKSLSFGGYLSWETIINFFLAKILFKYAQNF